jgi:sn1-specific diacylglycerol lipase
LILKYRVILNGFAYALLGIPSRDLEKTWYDVNEVSTQSNHSSTLLDPQIIATITNVSCNCDYSSYFLFYCLLTQEATLLHGSSENKSRPRLFNGGKILHIARKKKGEMEKKLPTVYEMRWAQPEDFTEMKGEFEHQRVD